MVNSTTLKERIILLLGLDKNEINLDTNIDTYLKRYKKVKKELAFDDKADADLIFQWLNKKNTNLKSLTAKNREKDKFEVDLHEVLKLQRNYYETEIYPTIFEDSYKNCRSLSDVNIRLKEKEYQFSLPVSGSSSYNGTTIDVKILVYDYNKCLKFDIRDFVLKINGKTKISSKLLDYIVKSNEGKKVFVKEIDGNIHFDHNQLNVKMPKKKQINNK